MLIDNTMFGMYSKCGLLYFERYEADQSDVQKSRDGQFVGEIQAADGQHIRLPADLDGPMATGQPPGDDANKAPSGRPNKGIELDSASESRDFGTRMHQLLHERRCRTQGLRDCCSADGQLKIAAEWPDEDIEAEAQATLAAYEAHYIKDFEYLESERTSTVQLPFRCPICWDHGVQDPNLPADEKWCNTCNRPFGAHGLIVKLDAVVRYGDGTIGPFDTKTEAKPGYNSFEDWAGRTQAKAYLYALESLYPLEKVSGLTVDVVTRGSPKARRGPIFTRLGDIKSTPAQLDEAMRNIVAVADDIERSRKIGWWRSNMNACKRGWDRCDYYDLHVMGRTEANLRKYRPAEQYLDT